MAEMTDESFYDLVMVSGDKLVTDSRRVARHFGRRHRDVMKAVRNLECSKEFAERNFALSFEINDLANGKKDRLYTMTKDGFMFLVMGFTGQKAAAIKEQFINAFNWMAEQLQRRDMSYWQQKQALILKDASSKARASYGSRLMLDRKRALPEFREEHMRLDSLMQHAFQFALN